MEETAAGVRAAAHPHTRTHLAPGVNPGQRRRVRLCLAGIAIPLALLTLIGVVLLWPHTGIEKMPYLEPGSRIAVGTVTKIGTPDKNGQTDVQMKIRGTPVPVSVPLEVVKNGLSVGDRIKTVFSPNALDTGVPYLFADFCRAGPILILLAVYLLAVLAVARKKGLAAIAGLAASVAVVVFFLLPALLAGKPAVLTMLVAGSAMMFVSIYFAHGISVRTTTAILGTFAGLLLTGLLAWVMIDTANLTGTHGEAALALVGRLPRLSLQSILLAGMILSGLGALNDVTVTQVSTVWELHAAAPQGSRSALIRQAMTVGRDHIASTVYTLAFAYIGTSLPLLLAASLIDRGFTDFLLAGEVAEEIVRTLVASVGLVLAIPLTTVIAAALAPVSPAKQVCRGA